MKIDNSSVGSIHIDNNNWFPFPPLKFQPDLVVNKSKVIWEKSKKSIDFKIKNKGIVNSSGFYLTIKYKVKNKTAKTLIRFWIASLDAGKSISKSFDLMAYSNRYTNYLKDVDKLIIQVDDSNKVKESNERNNIEVIDLNEKVNYTINVKTGDISHAGTDARVYIKMYGTRAISEYIHLDNSEDNHERGKTDSYTISHKNLGSIRKIEVKHDNDGKHPGWFLEHILIKQGSYRYNFTAKEWLSTDSRTEHPTIILLEDSLRQEYRITVTTSNIADAGTDATIYIKLFGEGNKKTSLQRIGTKKSDFEKGNTKTYIVRSNFSLGEIEKIYVEQDNTGKGPWWHLEKIIVKNRNTNATSTFNANKWIGGSNNKIVLFKDSPIRELELDSTRQVRITESSNTEKIELLADGENYTFNCSAGAYKGCGIDAAHSFMGWFNTTISRATISRYVETTNLTGTIFGDFKKGDTFTSPAQMAHGLNKLVNNTQSAYRNKITRHHKDDDNSVITQIRDYLRNGMPVVALIKKGYHWVTIVGMECHYTSTKKIDLNNSTITYIDLTNRHTYTRTYASLKICGWSSFWGSTFYPSYEAGTIISLHNHLLRSSHAKKAYRFEIHTSTVLQAGTDANIRITLNGRNGHSATYAVNTICNDFEKGTNTLQSFIVHNFMSEIRSITINRDNSGSNPDWHVSYIDIIETKIDEGDGTVWHFPIYDWIDSVQNETFPHAEENDYRIKVYTGDRKDAGTDARVYIKLYGVNETTNFLQLDNLRDNHEKGAIDVYTIPHKNIGFIKKIEIKHDNAGKKAGWFLEKISIKNNAKTYNFSVKKWLIGSSNAIKVKEDSL